MRKKQNLESVPILVDGSQLTLKEVKDNPDFTLLLDLTLHLQLKLMSIAVMGKSCLVSVGDYMRISDSPVSGVNTKCFACNVA